MATPRKPNKKQKAKIDRVIDKLKGMSDDEAKFVFEGGSDIYIPVFKEYLKTFWDIIKEQTNVQSDYDRFKDTSLYERYMLNSVQFAAAKSVAVNGMMKTQLFKDDGVRKGFSAFKNDCKAITDITNETWLRTEYDTAVRQAVSGQQFISYREDADLYPYWVYLETTSEHPREEHLDLVGNVYRIGDPEGDMVFPPNGFNCFKKGMFVRTKDGNKPIENITKNDFILTRKGYKKVIAVINSGIKTVYGIHFDNDIYRHTFYCSLGHEIYTKELGFIAIQDLDLSQEYTLINIENGETKFKISINEYGNDDETFDLKVSGESEYFVNNILVHNCSCGSEQVDDEYLKENGKSVRTNAEAKEDLENGVPAQFRFNPADQGICPKEGHSYFQALPNANSADGSMFSE